METEELKISIINCCDHVVEVRNNEGKVFKFWPSNQHARLPLITYCTKRFNNGLPIQFIEQNLPIVGLPDPRKGVMYIVSGIVFNKTDRTDVLKPDASAKAIREFDENGRIINMSVPRLIGKQTFNKINN